MPSKQRLDRPVRRNKSVSHANRGKHLERLIDITNRQYRHAGRATIHKIPTPVQITSRNGNRISGRLERGELVDYIGMSNGRAIAFDAKQTAGTSFPLGNLQLHQYEFLERWHNHDGIAFLIVHFSTKDEYYYLPFKHLKGWKDQMDDGGRKSIPYTFFQSDCEQIELGGSYLLDYLSAVGRDRSDVN